MTIETTNETKAPDFTEAWAQIREGHASVVAHAARAAAEALRVGRALIEIRDALPRGTWLTELRKHMSQAQASRYIRLAERFAKMSDGEREILLKQEGPFSLSRAVGESPRKKDETADQTSDYSSTNSQDVEIPGDEIADRRAEVEWRLELTFAVVDAIEKRLAGDPLPEYDRDPACWENDLHEVVESLRAVAGEHLLAELKRGLPC